MPKDVKGVRLCPEKEGNGEKDIITIIPESDYKAIVAIKKLLESEKLLEKEQQTFAWLAEILQKNTADFIQTLSKPDNNAEMKKSQKSTTLSSHLIWVGGEGTDNFIQAQGGKRIFNFLSGSVKLLFGKSCIPIKDAEGIIFFIKAKNLFTPEKMKDNAFARQIPSLRVPVLIILEGLKKVCKDNPIAVSTTIQNLKKIYGEHVAVEYDLDENLLNTQLSFLASKILANQMAAKNKPAANTTTVTQSTEPYNPRPEYTRQCTQSQQTESASLSSRQLLPNPPKPGGSSYK